MALSVDIKQAIVQKFAREAQDTGSTEVQIALRTANIKHLTDHMRKHPHDYHSRLGLLKQVSQRRSLLKYLKRQNINRYQHLIAELGLRA